MCHISAPEDKQEAPVGGGPPAPGAGGAGRGGGGGGGGGGPRVEEWYIAHVKPFPSLKAQKKKMEIRYEMALWVLNSK